MSSFNASYSGQQAHAWTVTFMSLSGDVGDLVVNATDITAGDVAVTERIKVRFANGYIPRYLHKTTTPRTNTADLLVLVSGRNRSNSSSVNTAICKL